MLEIIDFLHNELYYDITEFSVEEQKKYLKCLYERYEKILPDEIELDMNK